MATLNIKVELVQLYNKAIEIGDLHLALVILKELDEQRSRE